MRPMFRKKQIVDAVPPTTSLREARKAESLGCGEMSSDWGVIAFKSNPLKKTSGDSTTATQFSRDPNSVSLVPLNESMVQQIRSMVNLEKEKLVDNLEHLSEKILHAPKEFLRKHSSYIRVADLHLPTPSAFDKEDSCANFHRPAHDPPPGMEMDPLEKWVALDDGAGSHAPIAPYAVEALEKFAMETVIDRSMWKDEQKTSRLLKSSGWKDICWKDTGGPIQLPDNFPEEEVLLWSGNFSHGLYGSDMTAIRSAGIVNMSPKALIELLFDNSRTSVYNKYSAGRTDLMVLNDSLDKMGPFGKSLTKVVRTESQTPMVKRKVQLVTMMHAKELDDGSGYLIVSRAVTHGSEKCILDPINYVRSEIMMGANLIRRVEGDSDRCYMISVNHLRPPMIPQWMAKKMALSAAPTFFIDLNNASEQLEE
mmetsp:Transcript_21788/g.32178  ORF Transcript_21788/g.32178 Transcript_21788/m.32178 type:complete len:424 (-) Transcript_21788:10-1281(-)